MNYTCTNALKIPVPFMSHVFGLSLPGLIKPLFASIKRHTTFNGRFAQTYLPSTFENR